MRVSVTPQFRRQFKKLEKALQEEALEKIELFKNTKHHAQLKVHKLKGVLKGRYSFSVNYKYRIVFMYASKQEAILLAIGDHDVYEQ